VCWHSPEPAGKKGIETMRTFNLPDLGEGLQEAEIVSWHVNPGDRVVTDQPLVRSSSSTSASRSISSSTTAHEPRRGCVS
jgi:hypothetical protein